MWRYSAVDDCGQQPNPALGPLVEKRGRREYQKNSS